MGKKAMSAIIATVILIALTLAVVAIVWGVVTNLVSEQLEETGSCFNIFGKIEFNPAYTCYNESADEFMFSVNVGDIEVDELVVMVSGQGTTKSYVLKETEEDIGLFGYPDKNDNTVKKPDKNSGLTYVSKDATTKPDSVKVSPVIGGKQCEVSDSIQNIGSCFNLS